MSRLSEQMTMRVGAEGQAMLTAKEHRRAIVVAQLRAHNLEEKRRRRAQEALAYSEIGGDPQDLEENSNGSSGE